MIYKFDESNYNPETKTLTIHGPIVREDVMVLSKKTGAYKNFIYDADETSEEYERNEGWDGEQYLAVFKNHSLGLTLRVWSTPYDEVKS